METFRIQNTGAALRYDRNRAALEMEQLEGRLAYLASDEKRTKDVSECALDRATKCERCDKVPTTMRGNGHGGPLFLCKAHDEQESAAFIARAQAKMRAARARARR